LITENKKNYLNLLAEKLKADIIHHNDFIGGRYSVLSEVGMLPAELMGLNINNFKQLNFLIKNKLFFNNLISNVSSTLYFIQKKKFNSIILNYDEKSDSLSKWYQQLIAESLGKKNSGILPIISNMPKDNHSVMQLYLDGFKNNFYTFFYVYEDRSEKLNNKKILSAKNYLKNKSLEDIIFSQKKATERVFNIKNIPFRSFEIKKRDEKTLGELFCFFILETILIAKSININPYDQPAVELIKQETKKILT
jgi:glucose-6-phosphate isomerase